MGDTDIQVSSRPGMFEDFLTPRNTVIYHNPLPYGEVFCLPIFNTTVKVMSYERQFTPDVLLEHKHDLARRI